MLDLKLIGAIVGLTSYIPIVTSLSKENTGVEQNFATWMLWAMLDTIATISTILEHGKNFWLQGGFVLGSVVVTILLIKRKQTKWTIYETVVSFLVFCCLVFWYLKGNDAGIIASVVATCIAGIPQLFLTYKKPATTPTLTYLLFSLGGFISFIGGTAWTVEERLFSGETAVSCLIIVLLSMRKIKQLTS